MAGAIKGITVEIGGDTTKLGNALKGVNASTKSLQSELKGVNTLLKMDPDNVTLIKQKQDLLNKSIAETKNKLQTLKEAQAQVQAQFDKGEITEEQYRDFQREIVNTEQKLKNLKKEAKQFGDVFVQKCELAGKKLQDVGGKIEGAGQKLKGLSAGAGAILGGSLVLASNFEDAMAKVNTIADTSALSLKDLTGQILDLSNQTGISANDIADATYNAISAGQKTGDAVNFVSNATSLAKAGFTDTASSIDVLTTIMNAYGLKAEEVGNVSDMLIQTQNKGKTTVAELSASMGKIIPTANAQSVALDQVCAGYAIMTANGIATAESTTYMNSMLNELGKSSTTVGKALKEKTGKSFKELMEDGNSLGDVLAILDDYAKENNTSFNELWGSAEAGKAGLTLLKDGAEGFNETAKGMVDSVGATDSALSKLETPSQKAKIALNQIKNSGITLGESLLSGLAPTIDKISSAVENITSKFNNLSPTAQTTIIVILGIVASLAPVLMIIGKVVSAVGTIITIIPKIKTAILAVKGVMAGLNATMLASPITWIIGAIVALIAVFVLLYKHCEPFREFIDNLWAKIKEFFSNVGEWFSTLPERLSAFIGGVKAKFNEAIQGIGDFFANAWTSISTFFTETIPNAIQSLVDKIGYAISQVIGYVVNFAQNVYNFFNVMIPQYIGVMIEWFKGLPAKIKDGVVSAITHIATWCSNMKSKAQSGITSLVNSVVLWFKSLPGKISSAISSAISAIATWCSNMKSKAVSGIQNVVSGIINGFKSLPSKLLSIGKNIVEGLWNGIKNATGWIKDKISSFAKGILDGMKSALGIHSPSRAFRDQVGKFIAEGVGVGITENEDAPIEALENMGNDMIDSAKRINGVKIDRQIAHTFSGTVNQSASLLDKLDTIVRKLEAGSQIVLDTGELVGATVDKYDTALSGRKTQLARGW